jgi:hypothetical protein
MTNTQPRHDAPATVPASVSAPQPPLNNPRHFLDKGGIGIGCVAPNLAWSNTKAPTTNSLDILRHFHLRIPGTLLFISS